MTISSASSLAFIFLLWALLDHGGQQRFSGNLSGELDLGHDNINYNLSIFLLI
jgi:hypothetical protein